MHETISNFSIVCLKDIIKTVFSKQLLLRLNQDFCPYSCRKQQKQSKKHLKKFAYKVWRKWFKSFLRYSLHVPFPVLHIPIPIFRFLRKCVLLRDADKSPADKNPADKNPADKSPADKIPSGQKPRGFHSTME